MTCSIRIAAAALVLAASIVSTPRAADRVKPRIRAITGFITIDANKYPAQLEETVAFLNTVRDEIKGAGYEVAGVRISTQPFPEYTRGLGHDDALAVLRGINDLAAK